MINHCREHLDTDLIENEINSISKSWSEYTAYLFDTIDYLQLHLNDLEEFYRLVEDIGKNQDNLKEKLCICNRKGEYLTRINPNDRSIELILEKLNRLPIDEFEISMNNLAQLLISSITDPISCQLDKLNEQLIDNKVVENQLDQQKFLLEQLQQTFDDQRLRQFNEHWTIMKQTNDLRQENLLLTHIHAAQFWSQYEILRQLLEQIDDQDLITNNKPLFEQFTNELTNKLIGLIGDNQQEVQRIEFYRKKIEDKWNEIDEIQRTRESHIEKIEEQ